MILLLVRLKIDFLSTPVFWCTFQYLKIPIITLINPTPVRLLSYQLLYGGGIYHPPPYKNLFKDQFDPIFCIGRGGGPKYHWKFF